MNKGQLKFNVTHFIYREVVLSGEHTYSFRQSKGSGRASIDLLLPDGQIVMLNANFDPTGKHNPGNGWGYPPPRSGLTIPQWSEHFKEALALLEEWGGYQKFNELEYVDHYFSWPSGEEITADRAFI